jgi:hypothetical protein
LAKQLSNDEMIKSHLSSKRSKQNDYFFQNEKNIPERDESRPMSVKQVEPEKEEEREPLSRQSTYASASLETSSMGFSQKDRKDFGEKDRNSISQKDRTSVAEKDRISFEKESIVGMTSQPISPPVATSPKKKSQLTKEQLSRELRSHLEEIERRHREESKSKKKSSRGHSMTAAAAETIDLRAQEENNRQKSSAQDHELRSQEFEEKNQRKPSGGGHSNDLRSQEFEEKNQRKSSAGGHSNDLRSQEFEEKNQRRPSTGGHSNDLRSQEFEEKNQQRTSAARSSDLRSHLEEFQLRHNEDLKIIKQCNLDIVLPEASVNTSKFQKSHPKHSIDVDEQTNRQSSAIRKEIRPQTRSRPSGSSEAESQPPALHFADSPEPDPFNFMSSVKRKFQDQNRELEFHNQSTVDANLASESMALSEGPLSITLTSTKSSKSSAEKKVSTLEEESLKQRREQKSVSSEQQNNDKQQHEQLVSFFM